MSDLSRYLRQVLLPEVGEEGQRRISASAAAVGGDPRSLAHEIAGRGVRVACVCPPIVDTPLLDQVGEGAQDLLDASKAIQPEQVLDAI